MTSTPDLKFLASRIVRNCILSFQSSSLGSSVMEALANQQSMSATIDKDYKVASFCTLVNCSESSLSPKTIQ